MPRPPTPYFQFYAGEFLEDEKIKVLSLEERGALVTLWAQMWVNGVKRGTLLLTKNLPIPDEEIAYTLKLSNENFLKIKSKFVDELEILKIGKRKELYSERLRKFKTRWELRKAEKTSKKQDKNKQKTKKRRTALALESASESASELIKNINPFVELFNSTCPSLKKVSEITKGRQDKIKSRLKEHPDLNWWRVVFEKANKIVIEDKDGGRGWRPTFNWLLKNDTKAVEVAEGNYDKFIKKESWREKCSDKGTVRGDSG